MRSPLQGSNRAHGGWVLQICEWWCIDLLVWLKDLKQLTSLRSNVNTREVTKHKKNIAKHNKHEEKDNLTVCLCVCPARCMVSERRAKINKEEQQNTLEHMFCIVTRPHDGCGWCYAQTLVLVIAYSLTKSDVSPPPNKKNECFWVSLSTGGCTQTE